MSKISDELRDFVEENDLYASQIAKLNTIADHIDRELVELPKDADGVPIHVGDMLRGCDAVLVNVFTIVEELRFDGRWKIDTTFGCITEPRLFVHDSPDSWERIADELEEWSEDNRVNGNGDVFYRAGELAERIRKLAAKEDER